VPSSSPGSGSQRGPGDEACPLGQGEQLTSTRREFLSAAGLGAAGLAVGSGATVLFERETGSSSGHAVPFYGEHQAGITTAAQDRLAFAAFDVTLATRAELRELFHEWTKAAALMTAGQPVGSAGGDKKAPPADTGEALGLGPSELTITFGLGGLLFVPGRFGLDARRPSLLRPLGRLPGDALDPALSDGDLCVQACANDPQVAFHAVRELARIGLGAVVTRWAQLGFGRTSSTTSTQRTSRNLQGFKDGTNNLRGDKPEQMNRFVWVGDEEPQAWFRGGSYLVARRIRMLIEQWDRAALGDQEKTIGRHKVSGAPLTRRQEHDPIELDRRGKDGKPVIPLDAHVRLAAPASNDGQAILRRGYSFTDGVDAATGELEAGLFFIAYQRDPHRQFAAIQTRLGTHDALNRYIRHTGGGLFAVPPGIRPGGFLAEGLFA
jgi:deferrochelatase/peroxidase EfeB